jgi:hypothetical protein
VYAQVKSTTLVADKVIVLYNDGTLDTLDTPEIAPKEYVALLTQDNTNAPVATVLKNTLGATPIWTYTGTGTYTASVITANPLFLTSKTVCESILQTRGSNPRYYSCGRTTDSAIVLYSMNSSLAVSDPATSNSILVTIKVYY